MVALVHRGVMVRVGCAALVSVAAVCALVPLRSHVASANLALILVLVVLGIAVVGGRGAGVAAGIVTAIAFDFFLTVPYGALTIDRSDDVQTTVLLATVGLVGGELVERARRSHAHALDRDREIERFQRRAELAAAGEPPGRLIAALRGGAGRPPRRRRRRVPSGVAAE